MAYIELSIGFRSSKPFNNLRYMSNILSRALFQYFING